MELFVFSCIGEEKNTLQLNISFFVLNTRANSNHSTVQFKLRGMWKKKYKPKLHLFVIFL